VDLFGSRPGHGRHRDPAGRVRRLGALEAKLKIAERHKKLVDSSRLYNLQTGTAAIYTSLTEFGGPMLPGLVRIGG